MSVIYYDFGVRAPASTLFKLWPIGRVPRVRAFWGFQSKIASFTVSKYTVFHYFPSRLGLVRPTNQRLIPRTTFMMTPLSQRCNYNFFNCKIIFRFMSLNDGLWPLYILKFTGFSRISIDAEVFLMDVL